MTDTNKERAVEEEAPLLCTVCNAKAGRLLFYIDGKLSPIHTMMIEDPLQSGESPKTRLLIRQTPTVGRTMEDGDYPTLGALCEDLVREVYDTKHDQFAQARFAWYHNQIAKFLNSPEDKQVDERPPQVVRIHEFVMQDVMEYSISMPTGEYAGKRWKRKVNKGGQWTGKWILGEYIDDGADDGTLLIRWTPIEVIKREPLSSHGGKTE